MRPASNSALPQSPSNLSVEIRDALRGFSFGDSGERLAARDVFLTLSRDPRAASDLMQRFLAAGAYAGTEEIPSPALVRTLSRTAHALNYFPSAQVSTFLMTTALDAELPPLARGAALRALAVRSEPAGDILRTLLECAHDSSAAMKEFAFRGLAARFSQPRLVESTPLNLLVDSLYELDHAARTSPLNSCEHASAMRALSALGVCSLGPGAGRLRQEFCDALFRLLGSDLRPLRVVGAQILAAQHNDRTLIEIADSLAPASGGVRDFESSARLRPYHFANLPPNHPLGESALRYLQGPPSALNPELTRLAFGAASFVIHDFARPGATSDFLHAALAHQGFIGLGAWMELRPQFLWRETFDSPSYRQLVSTVRSAEGSHAAVAAGHLLAHCALGPGIPPLLEGLLAPSQVLRGACASALGVQLRNCLDDVRGKHFMVISTALMHRLEIDPSMDVRSKIVEAFESACRAPLATVFLAKAISGAYPGDPYRALDALTRAEEQLVRVIENSLERCAGKDAVDESDAHFCETAGRFLRNHGNERGAAFLVTFSRSLPPGHRFFHIIGKLFRR